MATEKIILSAVDQTRAAFQSVQGNISRLTGSLRGIAGPLAAAFSVGAITSFSKSLIDAADNLKDLSESTGISAEELSRFGNAAQLNGASTEEFQNAIVKFSNAVGEAAAGTKAQKDAFEALGISIKDANGNIRPTIDLFRDVADRFSQTADGAGKLAIAQDLLGRAGSRLIPVLNQGSDALNKYQATFSNEFIEAAGQFNDEIDKLTINFQRLASTNLTGFLQAVNKLLNPDSVTQAEKLRSEIQKMQGVMSASVGTNFLERVFGIDLGSGAAQAKIEQAQELLREINRMEAKVASTPAAAKPQVKLPSADAFKAGAPKQTELEQEIKAVQDVLKSIQTPLDVYNQKLRELDNLKEKMLITDEQYLDRLMQLEDELQKGYPLVNRSKTALQEYADATQNLSKQLEDVAISGLQNLEDALVNVMMGTMSVKDAFKAMTVSILSDLAKILIRKSITGPLADVIGGFFGAPGKAIGGAVQSGQPYVVGERGPELFVPNQSGSVVANKNMTGGGATNVVVNVNMDNGTTNATDANKLGILIGNVVKGELVKQKRPGGLLAS